MATRNENGMGSVYKRKDLKRRPWIAVAPTSYELLPDGTLRVVRQVLGHFEKSKEAHEALEAYRRTPSKKYNITLGRLHDEWEEVAFRSIGKSTQDNYRAAWKRLEPYKNWVFRDIRTAQLQKIIDNNSSLSASSLQKIKALLTQLYTYALQNDVVQKNYASFIVLPKKQQATGEAFTDIEVEKIRKAVGKVDWADVILLMCYTGWRISEFLELTPFAYDASAKTLTGGKKTDAGRDRVVPVHPKVQPILDAWLAKGGETIICKDDGTPWKSDAWRRQCWYPALDQIGVRPLKPHSTRHTFATMGAAAGLRPEDLQALLGHESYEVTAGTYIHQSVETLRTAVDALA